MYTNTRTQTAFGILAIVVATTALTLVTWNTFTYPVSAAKAHHSGKTFDGISSSSVGSTSNTASKSVDDTNLTNLFACESAAANGSGQLTQNEVLNCYSQAFSGDQVAPLLTTGNNNNSVGDITGSSSSSGNTSTHSGSVATHHAGSSSSHIHHHHGSSSSSPSPTASSSSGP